MFLGIQDGKKKFYSKDELDLVLYNLDEVIETDDEYVLDGDEYILKDDAWVDKQAQIERERIAKLNLTSADVERGIYKAKGMDFDDVIELVQNLQPDGVDIKALKIELKANNFYRGNPYVEVVGKILGFTEKQLDEFFEDGNYEHLLV